MSTNSDMVNLALGAATAYPVAKSRTQAEKRCYTVDEVCAILGVSRNYVYDLLKLKAFRWFRLGTNGRYRISKAYFDNWLENNT